MRKLRPVALVFPIALVLAALAPSTAAQASKAPTSGADRLFRAFAEEAAIIHTQWWEGQVGYVDGSPTDATLLNLVVALEPWQRVELGGRVGFGSSDAPGGLPDGSGATDLEVWGKFGLGNIGANTQFAVGALATVPTGDDTAGLGRDAFDLEIFGSVRHRLPKSIVSAYTGARLNGDGRIHGVNFDGRTSFILGTGLILPVSDQLSVVGELNLETERVRLGDSDFRILAGANWRPFSRSVFRGALAVGLTDGAPDAQLTVGYAYTF